MFEFLNDIGNYESRKLGRDQAENGLEVSTAYTSDEGYETALIDKNGVHPVERYQNRDEAEEGHAKWKIFAKTVTDGTKVTKLGGMGGFVGDEGLYLSV